MNIDVPSACMITSGKRFFRFDRLFNDAVRSKEPSAIVDVLMQVQLPEDKAWRTAEKILAERQASRARRLATTL